jgi:hypothetical protein
MTLPFNAYQLVMLLLAGVAALGGYFHLRYEVAQHRNDLAEGRKKMRELETKVHALELAHAGHTSSLEQIVQSLRDTLAEMRKELASQREVTLQLERTVARMGANHP